MKAWLNLMRKVAAVCLLTSCLILAGCCGRKPTLEDAGKAYQSGDFAKASEIFMPAAEQGDAEAQVNIAFMYYCGMHFPKDHKKAAEWYLKAAKRNHANAQFSLGTLYENGEGVNRSIGEAYFWYSLAEKNGDKDAKQLRQELELKLNSNQIKELKKRLSSWKPER
ncbi:MAG: tetratricopeptide repeat protein [Candidatus Rifleibacteriota bacterium]